MLLGREDSSLVLLGRFMLLLSCCSMLPGREECWLLCCWMLLGLCRWNVTSNPALQLPHVHVTTHATTSTLCRGHQWGSLAPAGRRHLAPLGARPDIEGLPPPAATASWRAEFEEEPARAWGPGFTTGQPPHDSQKSVWASETRSGMDTHACSVWGATQRLVQAGPAAVSHPGPTHQQSPCGGAKCTSNP